MGNRKDRLSCCMALLIAAGMLFTLWVTGVKAEAEEAENDSYTNPVTGHQARIIDELGTLSAEDKAELLRAMEPITRYGDAAYKTTVSGGAFDADKYMDIQYGATMAGKTGVLVLLDAGNHSFKVRCGGKWEDMITKRQADTIAANALRTFEQGGGAVTVPGSVFEQVFNRLEQVRKARPVKYICNAMLALILAMLINFVLVDKMSRMQKTSDQEILESIAGYCRHGEVMIEYLTRTETYSPQTKR